MLLISIVVIICQIILVGLCFVATQSIDQLGTLGLVWLFVSPFWTIVIAWVAFARGRTIEILENAKLAVEIINDNKHHLKSITNTIKSKLDR